MSLPLKRILNDEDDDQDEKIPYRPWTGPEYLLQPDARMPIAAAKSPSFDCLGRPSGITPVSTELDDSIRMNYDDLILDVDAVDESLDRFLEAMTEWQAGMEDFPSLPSPPESQEANSLVSSAYCSGRSASVSADSVHLQPWETKGSESRLQLASSVSTGHSCSALTGDMEIPAPLVEDDPLICYGTLPTQNVKLTGEAQVLISKIGRHSGQQPFRSKVERTEVMLTLPDGTVFGQLNKHASKALERAMQLDRVESDGVATSEKIMQALQKPQHNSKSIDSIVMTDLIVYGPRSLKDKVGKILSDEKAWLQRPLVGMRLRPGAVYDNPHLITFEGIELPEESTQGPANSLAGRVADGDHNGKEKDEGSLEQFKKEMAKVYGALKRSEGLNRVSGDHRLNTELLPHQEEGLDFMTQRETGKVDQSFRLWRRMEKDGEIWFEHSVTRQRCATEPVEKGGGILADEMGMGKSLSILALIIHTLDDAQRWAAEQRKNEKGLQMARTPSPATLVIVSSSLLINTWYAEIEKHIKGTLNTIRYHGSNRSCSPRDLDGCDMVITTYNTLALEFGQGKSPLHSVNWFRVVLDEAHIIRRPATTFFKSCADLSANSRWCLTGTPIQNRLDDIGALFAFVRANPFHHAGTFRQHISIPFHGGGPRRGPARDKLVSLMDSLCLRRTTDRLRLPGMSDSARAVCLTPAERLQYAKTRRAMGRVMERRVGLGLGGRGGRGGEQFGRFQADLQLRIFCNHGTFQHEFSWSRGKGKGNGKAGGCDDSNNDGAKNKAARAARAAWAAAAALDGREALAAGSGPTGGEVLCSKCVLPMPVVGSNRIYNAFVEGCGHVLCSECLEGDAEQATAAVGSSGSGQQQQQQQQSGQRHCPLCVYEGRGLGRLPPKGMAVLATPGASQEQDCDVEMVDVAAEASTTSTGDCDAGGLEDAYFRPRGYSSKMEALMVDVKDGLTASKSIIFSCWTRTLNLVSRHLDREGISFGRIDGATALAERQKILDNFARDPTTFVLIMTTGTGAYGLNLTVANRVFIVEPQWNPSVENQAIARAIRLGQDRKVCVTRYVVQGSIEELMLQQQTEKREIAAIGKLSQAG